MAHACFRLFGEGAWGLRLPAALFGVGSIGALYLVARQVTATREALFAAALFAFSYHHVWFSQNARGYSGLLFWTLLSSWALLRALRERKPALWLWFAAAVTLGVYTHITILFVVAGQFAVYLWDVFAHRRERDPHRWDGLLLGFSLAGLLTLQLHALVLPQILGGMAKTVSYVDAWKKPLWTLLEIFHALQVNFAGAIVAIGAIAVFAAGLASYARRSPAILQLLLIPPVIGATIVMSVGHHLWPRFFFFAFGFGALVAIRGAMALEELVTARFGFQTPGVLCAGMVAVAASSLPVAYAPKQDYTGAMAFVEANRRPGDAVVTVGLATFPYTRLYKAGWTPVKTIDDLNNVRAASKRTLLLYTLEPVLASMQPDIYASVGRDFHLLKRFPGTLQNGAVYVYVSEAPPAGAGVREGKDARL
jgi:4-amino-4-deoxy-L-arabinose transferase-like glycosyltransferase